MESRIDHLPGLEQNLDQVMGLGRVVVREERERGALLLATSSAADSVHIVFRVVGVVVVNHKLDVVDIFVWSTSSRIIEIEFDFVCKDFRKRNGNRFGFRLKEKEMFMLMADLSEMGHHNGNIIWKGWLMETLPGHSENEKC